MSWTTGWVAVTFFYEQKFNLDDSDGNIIGTALNKMSIITLLDKKEKKV